ncbi:tRNA (adenosine(37)-N6)-threonylcarbamoyltransferase complex dimerization subunit type 1 TsaB [Chlamydiota bacterium]
MVFLTTLIIDTSTDKSLVVFARGIDVLLKILLPPGAQSSRHLMGAIVEGMTQLGLTPSDLQAIAVGVGPGSYTGIRVGVAAAKGLAFPRSLPLVGFCSLAGFVTPQEGRFASLIDARIGGAYILLQERRQDELIHHSAPRLVPSAQLPTLFQEWPPLALTLYFLFVGNTPSILRAWTMAVLFLVGLLIERRSSAINALGVALCLSSLCDPFSTLSLSFQLSFLATAGILFFYTPCDQLLQRWLPKRALADVVKKHWTWQYGYIGCAILREGFALTAAVHITLLPLLFGVFHSFPLSSLIYNLFFPFLASLALLLFLVSLPLGPWGHLLNGYYCDWILRITESPPIQLKTLYAPYMPSWLLSTLLTSILILAIFIKMKKSSETLPFPHQLH